MHTRFSVGWCFVFIIICDMHYVGKLFCAVCTDKLAVCAGLPPPTSDPNVFISMSGTCVTGGKRVRRHSKQPEGENALENS